MKNSHILTVVSLLSILFLLVHLTDDFVRGISKVEPWVNLVVFPVFTVFLYGALVLAERRSGYIIQLVAGLFALGMPGLHFRGARINDIAQASGGFFTVFTLLLLGTTGLFGVVLSVRGLWSLRKA